MKKIIFVPYAGLCNRANAIMSAIALLENCPDVCIQGYWPIDKDCHAKFEDLFQPLHIDNFQLDTLNNPIWNFASIRNLHIPAVIRKLMGYTERMENGSNELIDNWIKEKKIYIASANRFHPLAPKARIGDIFLPTNEIEEAISSITSKYSKNTVGVHVRRTDNRAAIANSPLTMYFDFMDQEIEKDQCTTFYLASDDESVKEAMANKYGDRIITGQWELKRNTTQGMKDAVAELFCLARAKKIIGSSCSTYSLVASHLTDIPITIVS